MNRTLIIEFCLFLILSLVEVNAQSCGNRFVNLSYSLNDVAFSSNESFIAVGDNGKILKTENGGINWNEAISGSSNNLRKIQMVNTSVGYILGDNGTLIKTDDGGNNWFALKPTVTEYPYVENLYFTSPDSGFVFGGDGKVFKTTDGGRTWNRKTLNSWEDLNSMIFINDSTGFVCGRSNTLFKTTNRGESWISYNLSSLGFNINFIKVVFVSDEIGYLLEGDGNLVKTTDGGDSWFKVGQAYTDYAVSMTFLNKNIGYIVGGWTSPAFYRTMNGGLTWQRVDFGQAGSLSGIAMNDTWTQGVVVGDGAGYGYTSESGRFILYLDQTENSWKNACYLNGSINFYDLLFTNSQTGYLTGGYYQSSGVLYKTRDQGVTWAPLSFNPQYGIRHIFAVNRDTLYISSDSTYQSVDGGETWKSLTKESGNMYFYGGNGVIQDFYSIYKSGNSGKTWEKVLTGSGFLCDVTFTNPSTGYAVGYHCAYTSVDSGKVWNPYPALPSRFYCTIYFQNKDTGFVGGDDGLLYRTRNGGIAWDSISTGITYLKINDVKFTNDTLGYLIAGNDGGLTNLYSTSDGGSSWQFLNQISENLRNIAIDSDGNIYFPGERGALSEITQKTPPSIAGSLKGPHILLKNTPVIYSTFPQPGSTFHWKVSSDLSYENFGDSIKVNFPVSGTYKLSVTPVNDCGGGVLRTIEITVLDSFPSTPVTPTSIPYHDVYTDIQVYPNPFDQELHTSLPAKGRYLFTLYNIQGKAILKAAYDQSSDQEIRIATSNVKSGIYFLEIERSGQKVKRKLIKVN